MTTFEQDGRRHAALAAMIERDRQSAWQIAHYERSQRDEYTSKLRFGLATLNAASLVTVLNLGTALDGVSPTAVVVAAGLYFLGTILAGRCLTEHQNRLIEVVGETNARAMILDRAVSLAAFPVGSAEYGRLGEAIEEAHSHAEKTYALSISAIWLQHLSASLWTMGSALLGIAKVASLYPAPTWAPWLAMS